jgi:hypothetical protein
MKWKKQFVEPAKNGWPAEAEAVALMTTCSPWNGGPAVLAETGTVALCSASSHANSGRSRRWRFSTSRPRR